MPAGDHRSTGRRDRLTRRRGRLDIVVADALGRRLGVPLPGWLRRVAPRRVRGSVGIALVSDARMRALNRRYRGVDRPTDVLSFPAGPPDPPDALGHLRAPASTPWLGDIVIALGVARRQARSAGHSNLTELKVLALHGLLHLLGYDHERDDGRMRRVERRLRLKGGLPQGLTERRSVLERS